jgi:hypothetical protein
MDVLLEKGGAEVVRARDSRGDLALHLAAQHGHAMCTFNLTKVCAVWLVCGGVVCAGQHKLLPLLLAHQRHRATPSSARGPQHLCHARRALPRAWPRTKPA